MVKRKKKKDDAAQATETVEAGELELAESEPLQAAAEPPGHEIRACARLDRIALANRETLGSGKRLALL